MVEKRDLSVSDSRDFNRLSGCRYQGECEKGSPYYKEYFTEQWKIYGAAREKQEEVKKNISYRNLLLSTLILFTIAVMATGCIVAGNLLAAGVILLELAGAGAVSAGIRKALMGIQKGKNNNNA